MHGVPRTRVVHEQSDNERQKIESYSSLVADIDRRRDNNDLSTDAFDQTTELLRINPEVYSIWNYRRRILLDNLLPNAASTNDQQLIIDKELGLVLELLRDHPKVYWIFNHRYWCLMITPNPDWSREELLVQKLLAADERNFHGWNCRRFVIEMIESQWKISRVDRELEYSKAAIYANLSNFSAYHHRTLYFERLILEKQRQLESSTESSDTSRNDQDTTDGSSEQQKDESIIGISQIIQKNTDKVVESQLAKFKRESLNEELKMAQRAIFTDPDDDSIWYYFFWLLGDDDASQRRNPLLPARKEDHGRLLVEQLKMIDELFELEPESRWVIDSVLRIELLLARLGVESRRSKADLYTLVDTLEIVDPKRRGKYRYYRDLVDKSFTVSCD